MLLSAVVFDFDGVIADSEPLHFEGFRRVLARQGVALGKSDYYAKYLGYDDAGAFRAVLADHGQRVDDGLIAGLVADQGRRCSRGARRPAGDLRRAPPPASPGSARGCRWPSPRARRSTTSKSCCAAPACASASAPSSPPSTRRAASRIPIRTSAPLDILREQGVLPTDMPARHVVAIEDSVWGLQSARDAGLRTVAVTTSYRAEELGMADLVVPSLDAVTVEALDALVARP